MNIDEIIEKYTTFKNIEEILLYYDRNDLSYHNRNHILDMIENLNSFDHLSNIDYYILTLAILFHDIIYDFKDHLPLKDNEINSALFAKENITDDYIAEQVYNCVKFTDYKTNINDYIKTHNTSNELLSILTFLDFGHLMRYELKDKISDYEIKIRAEYPNILSEVYKSGRLSVLTNIRKFIYDNDIEIYSSDMNIDTIISYYTLEQKLKFL